MRARVRSGARHRLRPDVVWHDARLNPSLLAERPLQIWPEASLVMRFAHWETTRSHLFSQVQHVNLQELSEGLMEILQRAVDEGLCPSRFCNWVDSAVSLGAFANGRHSSFLLNGLLRRCLSWSLLGRKQ